jgi:hypothetical protein
MLRPELMGDRSAAERFWQAARSAARSRTAPGQRVLDGGTDPESGRQFVVCEWPGQSPATEADAVTIRAPTRVGNRNPSSSRVRPDRRGLLGLLLVAALGLWALRSGVQGWLTWVNEPFGQANQSFLPAPVAKPPALSGQDDATTLASAVQGPTVVSVTRTVPPAPAAPPAPPPTATAGPNSGVNRRVVNTDGRGVALRATPGGDRLPGKGYDEGATVLAFEKQGEWTRIRGSDGREGWVLSVTLAP